MVPRVNIAMIKPEVHVNKLHIGAYEVYRWLYECYLPVDKAIATPDIKPLDCACDSTG